MAASFPPFTGIGSPAIGIRKFDTGATRNSDEGKPDYEGFLSPLVIREYGRYMLSHQRLEDGSLRASDNWQAGIPLDAYIKSAWRHFFDVWAAHRGLPTAETQKEALCALLFNTMGYLHELLKAEGGVDVVTSSNEPRKPSGPASDQLARPGNDPLNPGPSFFGGLAQREVAELLRKGAASGIPGSVK